MPVRHIILATLLLVAIGAVVWPLIAKAQQTTAPQYLALNPDTVLDAQSIDWNTLTEEPAIVEQMVRTAFPDAPVMLDIARAESNFNPDAKNASSTASGVFQILVGTWADPDGKKDKNDNPIPCAGNRTNTSDNIACARRIYNADGTTPWNSSKSRW